MAFSFEYFSPDDAEQYAFFRIPKLLIRDPKFKPLSTEAKLLYGILLDRVALSLNHGWVDENNHVYIIYTIEQIMDDMACSNKKAIATLKELEEKVCLIERKRQGQGKPNLIYVKNFFRANEELKALERSQVSEVKKSHFKKCKKVISGNEAFTLQEVNNVHANNTDINKTEYSKTDLILSDQGERDEVQLQVKSFGQFRDYFSVILGAEEMKAEMPLERDTIDGILELLAEVCTSRKKLITVSGEQKPTELVKSRLMKLNSGHLRYVLHCLRENTVRPKNVRQYLLAILFNAPVTIGPYYSAWVSHDMAAGFKEATYE